jgi:hypothetical protein
VLFAFGFSQPKAMSGNVDIMKNILYFFILLLSGELLSAQPVLRLKVSSQAADSAANQDPLRGIRRLSLDTSTHVVIQFQQPPSAEILDELAARGAVVLQGVPDNGVLVTMSGRVPLEDLGIQVAAPFDPREKVSPLIGGSKRSRAAGSYVVEFHPDVDMNDARGLLLNLNFELRENPDLAAHHLMVRVPNASQVGESLAILAAEDAVAYIFPASDDLSTGRHSHAYSSPLSVLGPVGQYIATSGDGWDGPGLNATTLNYVMGQMATRLPAGVPQAEILRAMAEWSDVIQLDWRPGSGPGGSRTVNILFAQGAHGDNFPFDGPGNVLAHTFYPAPPNPEPIAGDLHCDDSENWNAGANIDLFSVALHELGHALGLGHSDNPNDVMYPYYKMVSTLAEGDKAAILTLYAARTGTAPAPTPVPAPLSLLVNAPAASTTASAAVLSGTVTGGNGAAGVSWSLSTGATGAAPLSGSNWVTSNIPLAIGLNTITVTASDSTGSVSRSVTITRQDVVAPPPPPAPAPAPAPQPPPTGTDKTGPTLLIAYPSATSFSTSLASVTFNGTASDASGVASVTWSTNTGKAGTATGTTQWNAAIPLLVGSNQVIVRATDTAGNVTWRSVVVTRR